MAAAAGSAAAAAAAADAAAASTAVAAAEGAVLEEDPVALACVLVDAGRHLRLPQTTVATALCMFHRVRRANCVALDPMVSNPQEFGAFPGVRFTPVSFLCPVDGGCRSVSSHQGIQGKERWWWQQPQCLERNERPGNQWLGACTFPIYTALAIFLFFCWCCCCMMMMTRWKRAPWRPGTCSTRVTAWHIPTSPR